MIYTGIRQNHKKILEKAKKSKPFIYVQQCTVINMKTTWPMLNNN